MLHCDFCGCCSTNRGKGWVAHLTEGEDAIDERVVGLAGELAADDSVAAGIQRAVGDDADDIKRALAVRSAFGD